MRIVNNTLDELAELRLENARLKRELEEARLREENRRMQEEIDRLKNPIFPPYNPYGPYSWPQIVYCSKV